VRRLRVPALRNWGVPGVFAVAAAATGAQAYRYLDHAVHHAGARAWLVVVYGVLRTAIALAFAVLTVGRSAPRNPSRSPLAFCACAAALAAVVSMAPPAARTPSSLLIGGELVTVCACAWLLISALFLGRCFGILPAARGLVTTGPYRFVRHPVYLGEIGACVGLALGAPSLRNALAVLALLAAQMVRMRLEERTLTQAFSGYASYARATPRLLPRPRLDFRLARSNALSTFTSQVDR
jgi:protein-S-isoprenylcysteine O-methyltransferase Ste14